MGWRSLRQTPALREMRPPEEPERGRATQRGALLHGLRSLLRRYAVRNERLQLKETLSLGGRRSVALIECDGKRFLAGLSASGVETIVPFDGAGQMGDIR